MPAPDSPSTSTSLLRRCRQHDADAWERFARLYGPLVFHWARRAGLQPTDAADVMQSVLLKLTTAIDGFERVRNGDSFRGWLWTITRNKVRDLFRQRHRDMLGCGGTDALQLLHELPDEPSAADSHDGRIELGQIRSRALQLVQSEFEGRTWVAFWRTVIEGDQPANVAADMGVSVWAVYKARSRVLHRLRQEFEGLI